MNSGKYPDVTYDFRAEITGTGDSLFRYLLLNEYIGCDCKEAHACP